MTIKINCACLSQQIDLVDQCADAISDAQTKEMLYGAARLLSDICFAVEEDESVVFEREDCKITTNT